VFFSASRGRQEFLCGAFSDNQHGAERHQRRRPRYPGTQGRIVRIHALWSGFDFSRRQGSVAKSNLAEYGFQATAEFGDPANEGALLGTAMAISGAAFNANSGFHTSPALGIFADSFRRPTRLVGGQSAKLEMDQALPGAGTGISGVGVDGTSVRPLAIFARLMLGIVPAMHGDSGKHENERSAALLAHGRRQP
jgi:hypothetical protein